MSAHAKPPACDPLAKIASAKNPAKLLDSAAFLAAVCSKPSLRIEARRAFAKHKVPVPTKDFDAVLKTYEKQAAKKKQHKPKSDAPYLVHEGCLARMTSEGPRTLCNFASQIVEQRHVDDGAEQHREFILEGTLATGETLGRATVPASKFYNPAEWVLPAWGARAIINPKDEQHVRAAIQFLSPDVKETRALAHTGWTIVKGRPAFVTAAGAIGAEDADITVQLDDGLGLYRVPVELPDSAALVDAVNASLRIIDLTHRRVTLPPLMAVWRAPLIHWIDVDLTLWLHGPSGAMKTSLAALLLGHFGAKFDQRHLTATWDDTSASIEDTLFRAKDVLAVVDDCAPRSADDSDRQRRTAIRIIQRVGNGAGRGRMNKDMTKQASRPPRGLLLGTSEVPLSGAGTLGRMLPIAMRKGEVDMKALSEAQTSSDRLPIAMRGYIEHLAKRAGNEDDFAGALRRQFEALRAEFASTASSTHPRAPGAAADLALGWRVFLDFALTTGAITAVKADELWEMGKDALCQQLEVHAVATGAQDPVRQWLECLSSMISAGRIELLRNNESAADAKSPGRVGGWRLATGTIQLLPEVVYPEVAEMMRKAGGTMQLTQQTLWGRLHEAKLTNVQPGHFQKRVSHARERHWVVELVPGALELGQADDGPEVVQSAPSRSTLPGPVDQGQPRVIAARSPRPVHLVHSARKHGGAS